MSETGKPKEISGRSASQGHIAPRTPARKAIFNGGLAGMVLLAVLLVVSGYVPTP